MAPSSQQSHRPLHDVDELLGDLVAEVVLHVLFAAEVERGLARRAGHHVPGGPALGDVVDRGEGAGHVVGLAEAGRDGGTQPDVRGRGAQHRDERGRLEAAQEGRMVPGIHDQAVGDEQQVELAALGLAGDLLDDREVVVAGRRPLVAPAGGVVAGAEDEHAEMHLAPSRTHARRSLSGVRRGRLGLGDNLPQAWRVAPGEVLTVRAALMATFRGHAPAGYLSWWRDPADKTAPPWAPGCRLEHHRLGLCRQEPRQGANGQRVSHEHERARSPPRGHHLLQLQEPRRTGTRVGKKGPRSLDRAHRHQLTRLQAPTHGRGHDPVHAHAMLAKCLSERPGLLAPDVIHVPLRLAVVEPEAGRVAPVAGRRVAMPNHGNVTALDERSPRVIGIAGSEARRADQQRARKTGPN